MNRRNFLGTSAASLIAAGVSNARFGLCDTAPRTQRDDLNPTGIRTSGIRMVPVVNGESRCGPRN